MVGMDTDVIICGGATSTSERVKDSILNIPLSHPPPGPCCEFHLDWVEDFKLPNVHKPHRVARIPLNRLLDFISGESSLGSCGFVECSTSGALPWTQRRVKATASQGLTNRGKPATYWAYKGVYTCSYAGKAKEVVHDANDDAVRKRSKIVMGESKKRECTCKFTVFVHDTLPEDAVLYYDDRFHVRPDGVPAHTYVADATVNISEVHHTGKCLSPFMKDYLETQLLLTNGASRTMDIINDARRMVLRLHSRIRGVEPEELEELWRKNHHLVPDDYKVEAADVDRVSGRLDEQKWKRHKDVATSVHRWVLANPRRVIKYQPFVEGTQEFQLVIQTEWQLQLTVKHGDGKPLGLDSTFSVNDQKWPLTTLMGQDDFGHGIPLAFSIMQSGASEHHFASFLRCVRDEARKILPELTPSCVIIDDCKAEFNAVQDVFEKEVKIVLCS